MAEISDLFKASALVRNDLLSGYTSVNTPSSRSTVYPDTKYGRLTQYLDRKKETETEDTPAEPTSSTWSWEYTPKENPSSNSTGTDAIIDKIVAGGYATDPEYGNKLRTMVAQTASGNQKAFRDKRYNSYISKGATPELAAVYAAQDALESGYGTHISGDFNYGGIKDFSGNGKSLETTEYENGKYVKKKQNFRNFKSDDDYTDYKLNLLRTRYNIV